MRAFLSFFVLFVGMQLLTFQRSTKASGFAWYQRQRQQCCHFVWADWVEEVCFSLQSISAPGDLANPNWLRDFFRVAQVLCCCCHRNHWLRGTCSAWRWNPRFRRPGACDCMVLVMHVWFRWQQIWDFCTCQCKDTTEPVSAEMAPWSTTQLKRRKETQKWMEMHFSFACHCCSQNLFCQLFAESQKANCLRKSYVPISALVRTVRAWSKASVWLVRIYCLHQQFSFHIFFEHFTAAPECFRMLIAPLRSEVVRRESGHMGIFPKQYLRSATDDWTMEKNQAFHFKAHIVKNGLFRTFGFCRRNPSLKTSNQRKFSWDISA